MIGIPFILSFIAKPFDYFLGSLLVKLEYVGLGNIMFTKFSDHLLHPEFIQEDVTVDNLLAAYKNYDRDRFFNDSKSLRSYLKHGSSKKVARIIEN